jgi:hypothetical protein
MPLFYQAAWPSTSRIANHKKEVAAEQEPRVGHWANLTSPQPKGKHQQVESGGRAGAFSLLLPVSQYCVRAGAGDSQWKRGVVESMGKAVAGHGDVKRGCDIENYAQEAIIHWNAPLLAKSKGYCTAVHQRHFQDNSKRVSERLAHSVLAQERH